MLARLLACLAAALSIATPLAAQSTRSGGVPPPIRSQRAPELPQELRDDYRDFCGAEHQSVTLPESRGARATFVTRRGAPDVLAQCLDSIGAAQVIDVDRLDHALMLLSYRPLEPFWPRMEAAWGSDLRTLREVLAYRARNLSDSGWGLSMTGSINRALAQAGALRDLGYFDETLQVLDAASARLDHEAGGERRADLDFERTMLAAYRAGTVSTVQGDAAAAAELQSVLTSFPRSSEHYANPLINYAAYLAEAGDNASSLRLIAPAYDEFRGEGYNPNTYQIGGSDREFAWIIACNRWRLEGEGDAQPYVAIVEYAEERPRDEYFAYVKPSTVIERRMYRCIGDAGGYFAQFTDGSLPPLHAAWLLLQPQWGGDNGPLPEWSVPAELAERFTRRYRVLPASYVPAMRRWGADRSGR